MVFKKLFLSHFFRITALVLFSVLPSWAQTVTTVAGNATPGYSGDDGPALLANLDGPTDHVLDPQGNLYIADAVNSAVRKVDSSTGIITTLAGGVTTGGYSGDGGPARSAVLFFPSGLAVDSQNNLYISDYYNNVVRKITASSGTLNGACTITTIAGKGPSFGGFAGDGGPATLAQLFHPVGMVVDAQNRLYIADYDNDDIRRVDLGTGQISTLVGTPATPGYSGNGGPATLAAIKPTERLALDGSGNLFFSDRFNFVVRKVAAASGTLTGSCTITAVAGNGTVGIPTEGAPATLTTMGGIDGLTVDCAGDLFVSDDIRDQIRKIDGVTGNITTVAGAGTPGYANGPALSAQFSDIEGLVHDSQGNLFLSDYQNHSIRKLSALAVVCAPTATLTFTPSPTKTPTMTPTATLGLTSTPTLVPTITASPVPCDQPIETFLYPNPAVGNSATILCNLCEAGQAEIRIYNTAAEEVGAIPFAGNRGVNRTAVDIGSLAHGVYYYLVQVEGSSGIHKSKTSKFAVVR